MSTLLYSKFKDEEDHCSSVTILQNRKKPSLQITCPSNHLSREFIDSDFQREDNSFHKRLSCRNLFDGGGEKSNHYTPKKTHCCKKIPVKETRSVRLGRHSSGRKMINEYVKERKISRGSYGKVVLYRNSNDGTPLAIKILCKSRLRKLRLNRSETAMTNVLREVSIMKTLEHPNIVNLIEVIDDPKSDYLYMVLEYVEGSSIGQICQTRGRIDETSARRYFKDIIACLIYLHSHNIVHGDIKPENLLLTRSGTVKICDFSVSHMFKDDDDKLWTCPGTPAFTPPECSYDIAYHGKVADTWAAGVTLYFMVVGCCPFLAESVPETYNKIVNSPLSLPEELDPELKDLLQAILCKDPMQRISLDRVAEHPWIVKEDGPILIKNLCSFKL